MPDFERVIDQLREHVAQTPEQQGWARGFRAGKKRARIEVAVILVAAYFIVAWIGRNS